MIGYVFRKLVVDEVELDVLDVELEWYVGKKDGVPMMGCS
jgi:hypothetical protein